VEFYGADMQLTLLYGLALAVPTVILAGVVFGKTFKNFHTPWPEKLYKRPSLEGKRLPGFGVAVLTALIPVLLMGAAAVAKLSLPADLGINQFLQFIGDPIISLLIAVLVAVWTLGMRSGKSLGLVMNEMADSVKPIAIIMLIIAGGGAFKEVLVASGTSDYIVGLMKGVDLSPLVLAWCIAAALRITIGSATVAALTAAGIIQPLVAAGQASPELLVLATGAGSLTFSQVNDTGFWLFKEYFNLSITQTLKSWTVMETIVSIVGLLGCLLLDKWV
jgi:gluconate transporter